MASTHRVLYDFASTENGMLAVSKGDLCTLLGKMDDAGWCNVRTAKGTGLVPSNYLERLMGKVRFALGLLKQTWYNLLPSEPGGDEGGTVHCPV